jgi:hypothetical protein
VKPEVRDEHDDDVAEGGGGKNEGEVGPGECGEVAGEEADEQRDADGDPRSENGGDQYAGMGQGNRRKQRHTAF